jgi:hypothetical protein
MLINFFANLRCVVYHCGIICDRAKFASFFRGTMSEKDVDDLVDDTEGGAIGGLSDEEIEKRVDAFNLRVKKNYSIMMSPKKFDTVARLKATRWLGESGEPTAIPYLLRVYNLKVSPDDKKNGIQAAAKDSLGMLKALNEVLEDDDEEIREMGSELVQSIVFEGKYGKPAKPSVQALKRARLGLIALAIVVFMIAILLPTPPKELTPEEIVALTQAAITPSITPTSNDPSVALGDFGVYYTALSNDLNVIRSQINRARESQSLDCTAQYSSLGQYTAPEIMQSVSNINETVQAYNTAETAIANIKTQLVASCASNQIPTGETLSALLTQFGEANTQLNTVISFFGANPSVVLSPTATAIAVATSTATPTATIDANFINREVVNIQTVLDSMRGVRGINTRLVGFWEDVQNGGRVGCLSLPAPTVPADVIINSQAAALVPKLQTVGDLLNGALQATRNSWIVFTAGCSADNLDTFVNEQLTLVQLASDDYEQVDTLLEEIRDEVGIR